jgi:membrane associated rhomboid family serine protease
MNDPIRRLKTIPWLSLLQVAALTLLVVTLLEFVISVLYQTSTVAEQALTMLFTPPLGIVLSLALAGAVGALAVYIMERFFQTISINTANLWSLLLCLIVMVAVKSILPIPALFVGLNQLSLMGMMLGIFLSSVQYWRRYG